MAKLEQNTLYAGIEPHKKIGKRLAFFGTLPLASPLCLPFRRRPLSSWTGLRLFYLPSWTNKTPRPVPWRMVFHLNLLFRHSVRLETFKGSRHTQLIRDAPRRRLANRNRNSRKNLFLPAPLRVPLFSRVDHLFVLRIPLPALTSDPRNREAGRRSSRASGPDMEAPWYRLHAAAAHSVSRVAESASRKSREIDRKRGSGFWLRLLGNSSFAAGVRFALRSLHLLRAQPFGPAFAIKHPAPIRHEHRRRLPDQRSENPSSLSRGRTSVADRAPKKLGVAPRVSVPTPLVNSRPLTCWPAIDAQLVSPIAESGLWEVAQNERKAPQSYARTIGFRPVWPIAESHRREGAQEKRKLEGRSLVRLREIKSLSARPGRTLAPILGLRAHPLGSGFAVEDRAPKPDVDRGQWLHRRSESPPPPGSGRRSIADEMPEALGAFGPRIEVSGSDFQTSRVQTRARVAESALRKRAEDGGKPGDPSRIGLHGSRSLVTREGFTLGPILRTVVDPDLTLPRALVSHQSPLTFHRSPIPPLRSRFAAEHPAPGRQGHKGRRPDPHRENPPLLGLVRASAADETPEAWSAASAAIPSRVPGYQTEKPAPVNRGLLLQRRLFSVQSADPITLASSRPSPLGRIGVGRSSRLPPKRFPVESNARPSRPVHVGQRTYPIAMQAEAKSFEERAASDSMGEPNGLLLQPRLFSVRSADPITLAFSRRNPLGRTGVGRSSQLLPPKRFPVESKARASRLVHVGQRTHPIAMQAEAKSFEERAASNSMAEPRLGGRTAVFSDLKKVARQDLQALSQSVYELIVNRVRREKERVGR